MPEFVGSLVKSRECLVRMNALVEFDDNVDKIALVTQGTDSNTLGLESGHFSFSRGSLGLLFRF